MRGKGSTEGQSRNSKTEIRKAEAADSAGLTFFDSGRHGQTQGCRSQEGPLD